MTRIIALIFTITLATNNNKIINKREKRKEKILQQLSLLLKIKCPEHIYIL